MKPRIKIDCTILFLAIILTAFLSRFPRLYPADRFLTDTIDFLGYICILKGALLRMAGRGHKKAHSRQGAGLVTTGIYSCVRNPMYLGTFLIGLGFGILVWPWAVIPVFTLVFYLRFRNEVLLEEKKLRGQFGQEYEAYCQEVPRIFPRWQQMVKADLRAVFPAAELMSTGERFGLLGWPVLAIVLEIGRERIVFGVADPGHTVMIYLFADALFALVFFWRYQRFARA